MSTLGDLGLGVLGSHLVCRRDKVLDLFSLDPEFLSIWELDTTESVLFPGLLKNAFKGTASKAAAALQ